MDITKKPKGPAIDISTIKNNRRPEVFTLSKYLTENETKNYRLTFLKDIASISKTPKWKEYLDFIGKNLSGDLESFTKESKEYIEKMIRDIDEKHSSETSLTNA